MVYICGFPSTINQVYIFGCENAGDKATQKSCEKVVSKSPVTVFQADCQKGAPSESRHNAPQ